jgi:integral membrane protein (TIGR01906 family)
MAETSITTSYMTSRRTRALTTTQRAYLALAVPILLVTISIRLVMTPAFLYFEYTRPGFPEDPYGFTQQDRLNYAPYPLNYLFNAEDIDYLGDLRFTDGSRMYNARELRHMRDVKVVTQYTFGFAVAVGLLTLVVAFSLSRTPETRRDLQRGLLQGGLLTLGAIASIVLLAFINWDVVFTGFHTIFFESGTWRFAYSDTLIRLFPEQFWFDALLTIGALTVIGASLITFIAWQWGRRQTG